MLKELREGAKSTVLKLLLFGLLILAMAGLVVMDVQGMFRGGVSNTTIAEYGSGKLSASEFDRLVQSAVRDQRLKQSDAYRAGLPQQVLNREIENRLFSMTAYDLGIRVDDALAAKQIKEILAPAVAQGTSEKEALQQMLYTYNVSEGQLVAMLKSQMASQQLINMIIAGARPPQQLVDDALKFQHEQRRGEYFRLTAKDIDPIQKPSEEALKSYYDSIAGEYALPEYRTLSVLMLDKKALGEEGVVSEERQKQFYEENIEDYQTPETRMIAQAVAQDEVTAQQVYAAAEKTKDLQKSAAAVEKGKASYIKPGSFTEAAMPIELSAAAFAAEAGKPLPPVKSPLGWHVLIIEKIIPATTRPFESVQTDIEKTLTEDKISEALYQRATEIDDEIAGGKTLAEISIESGIPEIVLQKIDAAGKDSSGKKSDVTLPLFDKVIESGFKLDQGAASPLIETPEGSFLIVGVREIFPSEQQPFSKVRGQVLVRWQAEQQTKALSDKAAKILERVKQGEAFEKIAASLKQTVQKTELVKRDADPEKTKIDKDLMSALFSLDGVGQATSVSSDTAVTILRLAERKVQPRKDISEEDVTAMEDILRRSLQQDLLEQYRASLVAEYDVRINDQLMSEMYAPKDEDALYGE